jgi:hypothetical protein
MVKVKFGGFISDRFWLIIGLAFFSIVSLAGCGVVAVPAYSAADIPIPSLNEWTDYGTIFEAGNLGDWDYQLFGGFTITALKKEGIYYLYYQGASGYRIEDDTVTWRAIGVATSPDGINFTKYGNNPVITWFPNKNGEEGAVSAGAALDENGEIVLYYGANTEQSATLINADGRLATSGDGLNFSDMGVVLDHGDSSLWGSGDELFPIIAIHDASQWFVYYIPNGSLQSRRLGVAWGDSRDQLTNSAAALSGPSTIQAWGSGGEAKIGPDTYALFLNDVSESRTDVRLVSLSAPNQLSAPVETYQFDDVRQATVLLDEETNTWFMYYRNADQSAYGLKLAPAGAPDTTPPSAPMNVMPTPVSDRQIDLSWDPAVDPETGIVMYEVYRDGLHVATVKGWNFSDTNLTELTDYSYAVSAVNYHGVEGARSVSVTATTLADVTLPRILSANAGGELNRVHLVFDEPVATTGAERAANYRINKCVAVISASLDSDLKTVNLTTSDHLNGQYQITVDNIQDRAETPNSIVPNTHASYLYTGIAGLAGAWTFDEGTGETVFDTANFGNDGALVYTDKQGPNWTEGKFDGGLQFDGVDDQVTISGSASLENVTDQSHTFAAWVEPEGVPPNSTPNDASYSILVREYTGLYYDHNRKFRAVIRLSDDTETSVSSDVFEPGDWHHVAMAADDAHKKLYLYIDGREASGSPVSYAGALADHEDAPYYIGTSDPLTERYELRFRGLIDEPRIFDRALGLADIAKLFAWSPSEPICSQTYLPVVCK